MHKGYIERINREFKRRGYSLRVAPETDWESEPYRFASLTVPGISHVNGKTTNIVVCLATRIDIQLLTLGLGLIPAKGKVRKVKR